MSKFHRISGLVVVIAGLAVAAGVFAQVYPARWEEPAAEAALTIDSFYVRTRSIVCPDGTGVDCDVPNGLLTTKCDTGDAAVGGSAYNFTPGMPGNFGNTPSRAWGVPQPKGWQGMLNKVQEGRTLFVKAVCANVL